MSKTIPWARVLVEGVVILVSILLAFGIDSWSDERQDREREQTYLTALRSELALALDIQQTSTREHSMNAAEALIGQAQGGDRAPLDSLYWWLSGLSQQIEFEPPRAAFDDLVSSGQTQLIQSDSLRLLLATYPAHLEYLRYADEQAWVTWEQRIQPFLEGRVPRVDRLRRGTFGSGLSELPFGPSPHRTDWDELMQNPNFESMLAERWMRLSLARRRARGTGQVIERILGLIDRRLGSM